MLGDASGTGGMKVDESRAGFPLACLASSCSLGSGQYMPTESAIVANDEIDVDSK